MVSFDFEYVDQPTMSILFSPTPYPLAHWWCFGMNWLLPDMFLRLTTNYVIKIQNYHNNTNTQPTLHRCQSTQKNDQPVCNNTQCLLVTAALEINAASRASWIWWVSEIALSGREWDG